MYGIFVFMHIIVCIGLILVVLFQAGKGAGLGNLFGGGGGDQLFSAPSGSAFIKKLTTGMAVVFMITSVGLTILTGQRNRRSLLEQIPMPGGASAPVAP
ncbi:MAG: preprotein translocase subunit SecG [Elusimicrobia bacterium RIFCSPLOWO2_01_FULL_59_12]|nr:MAG: preprotein translocase subunit SecG [Elusimicrobia bacterium RIFCSPLOWO2_01_FULL_59_12]